MLRRSVSKEAIIDRHSNYRKISNLVAGRQKILDVGCGAGPVGRTIRTRSAGVELVGIDKDSSALEKARKHYDNTLVMDLDSFNGIPYDKGYFDAIILADVLEHLKRPATFLNEISTYLKQNGAIIVSLPNIARIEVRIRLLLGKFNYTISGIMDSTHLHFYTYQTGKFLVENAGYVIDRVEYTGLGSKVRLFPRLLSYQFIIAAHPSRF